MSALETLMEMGFSKAKSERALAVTGNKGAEQAMDWLLAHANEPDPPETSSQDKDGDKVEDNSGDQAKSIKCDDCGKLFKSDMEVEYHAAKSQHTNFSESTEEIKPLTEEERAAKKKALEERLKERRRIKEEEDKQEAIEKEKQRRKMGKDVIQNKKELQDLELKKMADERKREKMEEKAARNRVLEQIARDKEARKLKYGGTSSNQETTTTTTPPMQPGSEPPKTLQPAAPSKEYSETRIQIRFANGKSLTQTFSVKEQLAAVKLYVEMNRTDGHQGPFTLMTTFPKKVFNDADMDTPLSVLGLVPSAVLILTNKPA